MKTFQNRRDRRGSVLLITLVTGAIIGLTLASYMTLINHQNRSTIRSTSWNSALALAEGGIEEALSHLNHNCISNPLSSRVPNWTADGWTEIVTTNTVLERKRWIGDGWYNIRLTKNSKRSLIDVIAAVPTPSSLAQSETFLLGQNTRQNNVTYTTRKIRVEAVMRAMFTKGLVAKGLIDMNGNNVTVDSFDSSSTTYSTEGRYDPKKRKDGGSVATNSGLTNSLAVGNANIYGPVATGPGGSVTVGSQGGVGSIQYQSTNVGTIQPNWFTDDMNMDFPDVENPITGGTISPLLNQFATTTNYTKLTNVVSGVTNIAIVTNILTKKYDMIFENGDYNVNSFDGEILVRGNARVLVTGDISLTGQEGVWITNPGKLQLYMKGANASFGGQGTLNWAGNATNFSYYGMPSNTSIDMTGNAAFIGVVYAPNAALQLAGGGRDLSDFAGAAITKTVKLNGTMNFHYDEALGNNGPASNFIIQRWEELAPPTGTDLVSYSP